MIRKILCISLIGLILIISGCVIPNNDIASQKIRFLGIMIGQNPATQVPEIYLGYGSVVSQRIPTSTNGPIYAPNYMDTFDLGVKSSFPSLGTSISEDTGTGNVMLDQGTQTINITTNKLGSISTNHEPFKLGSRFQKK